MRKLSVVSIICCLIFVSCQDDDEATIINNSSPIETPEGEQNEEVVAEEVVAEEVVAEEVTLAVNEFQNLFAPVDQEAVRDRNTGQVTQPETGAFVKFDLETGTITEDENDWDIAFRTSAIIINGGLSTGIDGEPARTQDGGIAIVDGLFDSVVSASNINFKQDSLEDGFAIEQRSDQGWYNYNFRENIVSPIPGKIIVVRTSEGNFAKVEILSYYKDRPTEFTDEVKSDDVRYYTFKYAVSTNGSSELKTNE